MSREANHGEPNLLQLRQCSPCKLEEMPSTQRHCSCPAPPTSSPFHQSQVINPRPLRPPKQISSVISGQCDAAATSSTTTVTVPSSTTAKTLAMITAQPTCDHQLPKSPTSHRPRRAPRKHRHYQSVTSEFDDEAITQTEGEKPQMWRPPLKRAPPYFPRQQVQGHRYECCR